MIKNILLITLLTLGSLQTLAQQATSTASDTQNPVVVIHTSKGPITLELYPDQAPISVDNFLTYVQSGFYEGTIFHRVKKRFMIQAGGYTSSLDKKSVKEPIVNESNNGLHNDRWTIAMARTDEPNSATSQFFINTQMNSSLNSRGNKPGYAVFGIVTDGQYVVKAIEKTETTRIKSFLNLPTKPIFIERVEIK